MAKLVTGKIPLIIFTCCRSHAKEDMLLNCAHRDITKECHISAIYFPIFSSRRGIMSSLGRI